MLRAPVPQASVVLFATLVAASARAQDTPPAGRVHAIPLPARAGTTLHTTGERVTPVRSYSLSDFIRRTYNSPVLRTRLEPDRMLFSNASAGGNGSAERDAPAVPLPLPPSLWIDAVFAGRETPDTLLSAISQSRGAALLYYGLLSLDAETQAWLATQPQLIAELARQRAAAFVVAAPGLRVRGTAVAVPGGAAATAAWESLVGHSTSDPAGFIRALLARDHGRLAFFFGTIGELTPGQLRVVLALDSPDTGRSVAATRRLHAVFERIMLDWRVDDNVFFRPPCDPALLAASLRRDQDGAPVVPGTREFWQAVFTGSQPLPAESKRATSAQPRATQAVDFAWLSELVFTGNRASDRRQYDLVLMVSRLEAQNPEWTSMAAVEAVRGALTHPALVFSLERAKIVHVPAFTAAVRRAERIAAIDDSDRQGRALVQFQGALALITRAAARGASRPDQVAGVVASLAAVELSDRGDYDGRMVGWLSGWLEAHLRDAPAPTLDVATAGPMERDALAALAGPRDQDPRIVEWEGTRYRLDFSTAEGLRIARLLGEHSRPFLSSARTLVGVAGAIGADKLTTEDMRRHADTLAGIAAAVGWEPAEGWDETDCLRSYGHVRNALQRDAGRTSVRNRQALAAAVLGLADDLLARGLAELAYAVAFGQPDGAVISPDAAARRHRFAPAGLERRSLAWQLPWPGTIPNRGWHVTGSLLGLDLRLAEFALVRRSSRIPSRKPTVPSDLRRVMVETVVLANTVALADQDRSDLLSAIRKGRSRLAAARTPEDGAAIADEIGLSQFRRAMLSWTITQDPDGLPAFLSLGELLWLGLERAPVANSLHAWGSPASPRTGCLCLELPDRQPWETLTGRQHTGALASVLPDLNLRLAELLDELGMPASLLVPVLAAATQDLIDGAAFRGDDDRQAVLDFVQSLRRERVEEYLALLTIDGPLVAVDPGETR